MASRAPLLAEEPDISGIVTEDDTPVDNLRSEKQQRLLTEPLYTSWSGPPPTEGGAQRPFLAAANVGLFAAVNDPPQVPDVFLSLDVKVPQSLVEKKNKSYFYWEFGKPPEVVIEIVSNYDGEELGYKLRRYARMHVDHYVVFDPDHYLGKQTLHVFDRKLGVYTSAEPWFEDVGLGLVEWQGIFEGTETRWLRWCTRDGAPVPTGAERARQAEARADRAEDRAQRLAERLRALGVDPNGDG